MHAVMCVAVPAVMAASNVLGSEDVAQFKPLHGDAAGPEWDALYERFYVRRFSTGETYHHQHSFSPPWTAWTRFAQGDAYRELIQRLDEMAKLPRERMEDVDPRRRFILFRDLWTVFDSLEATMGRADEATSTGLREVQRRLARIMQRLELSPAECAALPDSFEAVRAAGDVATAFDPARADRPFMPLDLLNDQGDWVTYQAGGRPRNNDDDETTPGGVGAPAHEQAVQQRSWFTIHLKHPQGRQAGVDLITEARKSPHDAKFPEGTMLALLRRALAATSNGKLATTNVVESLQLLVTPAATEKQDVRVKFVLDRAEFIQGRHGLNALSLTSPIDAFSFESSGQWAQVSKTDVDGEPLVLGRGKGHVGIPSMQHCAACHGLRNRALYANFGTPVAQVSTLESQRRRIERSKSDSDAWKAYLSLRSSP